VLLLRARRKRQLFLPAWHLWLSLSAKTACLLRHVARISPWAARSPHGRCNAACARGGRARAALRQPGAPARPLLCCGADGASGHSLLWRRFGAACRFLRVIGASPACDYGSAGPPPAASLTPAGCLGGGVPYTDIHAVRLGASGLRTDEWAGAYLACCRLLSVGSRCCLAGRLRQRLCCFVTAWHFFRSIAAGFSGHWFCRLKGRRRCCSRFPQHHPRIPFPAYLTGTAGRACALYCWAPCCLLPAPCCWRFLYSSWRDLYLYLLQRQTRCRLWRRRRTARGKYARAYTPSSAADAALRAEHLLPAGFTAAPLALPYRLCFSRHDFC
jgi:hypothetical protein